MVLASQDSGEEILGMKCLGRLQKKKVWEVMNFKMPKIQRKKSTQGKERETKGLNLVKDHVYMGEGD